MGSPSKHWRQQTDSQGICWLTLDRADSTANTLSSDVLLELAGQLDEIERSDVRGVVIRSAKSSGFILGADVTEFARLRDADEGTASAARGQALLDRIAALRVPTVAAIDGYALGGGLELALCADFRVLGENAKVGQPEILLGVIPGAGGTQRLPRLIGPARAKDLIFTGRQVTAAEALAIGLADRVVPDADVYQAARELVARYASGPALALRAAKQAVDMGIEVDLATGLEIERLHFAGLFATADQKAGMRSFMENGPGKAVFEGR